MRIWAVIAIGVGLSLLLWWGEEADIRRDRQFRLDQLAARISEDIQVRFGRVEQSLFGLRGLYATNGAFDRPRWETYLDHLQANGLEGLYAYSYLRRVTREDEATFVAEMRADDPSFSLLKQGDPAEMAVIVYRRVYGNLKEPEHRGIDRAPSPGWRSNIEFTRRTGSTGITGPVPAIGEPNGVRIVVILPIYRPNHPLATEAQRVAAHHGWVAAGLHPAIFFDKLHQDLGQQVRIEVADVTNEGSTALIYGEDGDRERRTEEAESAVSQRIFNRVWRLRVSALPGFHGNDQRSLALQLFGGGVLTTLLIATLVWNLSRTQRRAVSLATDMTRDLQEREWVLRQAQRIANIGISIYDFTEKRTYYSDEYLKLVGLPTGRDRPPSDEEILAVVHAEDRSRARDCIITFREGRAAPTQTLRIVHPTRGERILLVEKGILQVEGEQPMRGIGIVQDITERVVTDRALADSHRRLDQLMGAMPGAVFQLRRTHQGDICFVFLSEGAASVFGIPAGDLIADWSKLTALMDSTMAEVFSESLAESDRTLSPWHCEALLHLPFGGQRWVRYSAIPERSLTEPATVWHGVVIDITSTKQAEHSLRENEQRLRFTQFAMDHARDAMAFLDPDGNRIYVNDENCRLTGYSRDELLRSKAWTSFPDFSEDDYRKLWMHVKRHGTHTIEMSMLTKTGEPQPVEMSGTFIEFSGREIVFAIARDVSSRKAAEKALRASEERLRFTQFALDHAQDIVSIMDRDGNRLYVSETFCNFTGRTHAELLVTKVWEGIPSLNRERFHALWDDVKRCGTLSFEIELLTQSGEKKPVETNASYLNFGGKEAVCTISRDLTARKSAELEKKRMQQQLQETQKLESLGVLAGGIAHDFNNLLTGILGNASLARDRLPDSSELHEPLRQIERASTRAAELCQQMLAYAGKGRFIVEPIDLSSLVEDTAKLLDLSIGRRATLELRLGHDLPAVLADATQMRQIVMNLVLNAAEAISHPQGKIVVSTGEMRIDRAFLASARVAADLTEGPGVYLEVSDNGEGMSRETLERVFEPFFTTKFTGRGLGLAAVLGIVRAHQGALHVQSERGRGTTFRLVLSPHHEAARKTASLPPFRAAPDRNQGRILVVDDEESVRSVTRQALERTGFVVETAEDGEVALAKLAPDPRRFLVILLDYTMPRLDGAQTLREILRLNPQARVILMSGFPEQEARERLGQDTLAGFVQKPFDLPTLRAQVERVAMAAASVGAE